MLRFSGTDTFTYKLCSVPEPATTTTSTTTTEPDAVIKSVVKPQAAAQHCDTADVTVTVLAPQQIAQAPSSPTPTTVAATELPHTGSSDTPLALLGLGLVVLGFAVTGLVARSRRRLA